MTRLSLPRRRAAPPNPSRVQLRRRVQRFARATEPGMLVLDAGAGRSPYRRLFAHAQYEAADFAQLSTKYAPLDYVCDLTDIPVEDARFDRVIFNQVLEHLPEPGRALAELHRVLKPGGRIFCSVPLFFEEHQKPYDFYRYTRFALRRLFEGAGFEIENLSWLEGYFGTVSYQFQMMVRSLPASVAEIRELDLGWRAAYQGPLLIGLQRSARPLYRFFARLETRRKYTARGMPKNYVVVARRPENLPESGS